MESEVPPVPDEFRHLTNEMLEDWESTYSSEAYNNFADRLWRWFHEHQAAPHYNDAEYAAMKRDYDQAKSDATDVLARLTAAEAALARVQAVIAHPWQHVGDCKCSGCTNLREFAEEVGYAISGAKTAAGPPTAGPEPQDATDAVI